MKVITRPRKGGKTTALILEAEKSFSYIVCPNQEHVQNVWNIARHIGANIPQPITFAEFVAMQYHPKGVKSFMVDDIDRCLQQLTPVQIAAVTITGENTS